MTEHIRATHYKTLSWLKMGSLVLAFLFSIGFFIAFAVPYLLLDADVLTRFEGRKIWIVLHILTGSIALLVGAPQLWMGLTGRTGKNHHKLGWIYLATIGLSSIITFYLAVTTKVGWVFGLGLGSLGLAWVLTGTLALIAIFNKNYIQHMEWMIRSYVVTLAFVFFRIFDGITEGLDIGTSIERVTAASWICWALPLLIAEVFMQGKKIFVYKKAS